MRDSIGDLLKTRSGIGLIQALQCSNVPLWSLYRWLEERLKFNCARILQNFKSPLISSSFKLLQTGTNCCGSFFNLAPWCFQMMNWSRECEVMWGNWEKILRENFKSLDLDLKKWLWLSKNSYDLCYIFPPNHSLKHV